MCFRMPTLFANPNEINSAEPLFEKLSMTGSSRYKLLFLFKTRALKLLSRASKQQLCLTILHIYSVLSVKARSEK